MWQFFSFKLIKFTDVLQSFHFEDAGIHWTSRVEEQNCQFPDNCIRKLHSLPNFRFQFLCPTTGTSNIVQKWCSGTCSQSEVGLHLLPFWQQCHKLPFQQTRIALKYIYRLHSVEIRTFLVYIDGCLSKLRKGVGRGVSGWGLPYCGDVCGWWVAICGDQQTFFEGLQVAYQRKLVLVGDH